MKYFQVLLLQLWLCYNQARLHSKALWVQTLIEMNIEFLQNSRLVQKYSVILWGFIKREIFCIPAGINSALKGLKKTWNGSYS